MRRRKTMIALTVVSCIVIVYAADLAAQEPAGDPARGETLFLSYKCYACHGYTGETGSTGVRLNPPRFPLQAFMAYVRSPSGRRTSGGTMPAFASDEVTDQVLADIYAYVSSLPSTTPPLDAIPLLADD
jgi:mono/diheme cytochrome c family protein